MFRLVLLSALIGTVVSKKHQHAPSLLNTKLASSPEASRRRLDGEDDISWLKDYNAVYSNCFHSEQTVVYYLCPRDENAKGRNSCEVECDGGARYLADMAFFIDAFTEAQMEAREYRCEYARENCEYEGDYEYMCYENSENGYDLSYCQNDWGEELDVQEYLECKELEDGYYVGPYCGEDDVSIYLSVFTDEDCTNRADDNSAFEDMFGYELPYSSQSLIGSSEDGENCASCKEHALEEDKNDGDQEDEDEVLEQCENLYEYTSTKCETNLEIDNIDDSGCDAIEDLLTEEQITISRSTGGNGSKSRKLWLAFLFIALAVVGATAYYVHKKKRAERKDKAKLSTTETDKKETLLEDDEKKEPSVVA